MTSDSFLKTILDSTEDTIAVFDTGLNYLHANKAACRLLNKTADDIIGKNLLELFPTLTASVSHRSLLKAISGDSIANAVSEGTFTQEGAKYLSNYSPVFNANNEVEAVVVITKKINSTDLNTAEFLNIEKNKMLEHRITELEDFIDHVNVPLHWVNGSGVIIWANKCELDMLGYSKQEYIGRHIANFHADSGTIGDILSRLVKKEEILNYPARLKTKSGLIKNVTINSSVYYRDGNYMHTRCVTREIV